MTKSSVALAGLLTFAASCGEKTDPVDEMLTALGGENAIRMLSSLAVEAECTGPSGPFRTEVQSLRPGAVYFHQWSERDTTEIWNVHSFTWSRERGKVVVPDPRVGAIAKGHEFHLLLFDFNRRFPFQSVNGSAEIDGHRCTRVSMVDFVQDSAAIFIDTQTHLPRMLEMNPPGAEGAVRVYFDDWRRIDDLLYFYSFRLTEGPDRVFTYRYTTISPNSVDPKLFETPEEVPGPRY